MSWWLWAIAFFWLGIAIYIAGPLLLGPYLPESMKKGIANHYFSTSMLVMDRALLIARKHGGYSLVPSSYDAGMESERVTIGDETYHFEDPYEFTTSLFKRRFGLADEERNVIINPRLAELGERFFDFYHENKHVVLDDDGKIKSFSSVFSVPELPRMVNLREARWMIPGSASPKLVESVKDDIEKSQLAYKERNYIDLMIGMMAFAMVFGLIVLAEWVVGSGGGGGVPGVNIGIFLGWF